MESIQNDLEASQDIPRIYHSFENSNTSNVNLLFGTDATGIINVEEDIYRKEELNLDSLKSFEENILHRDISLLSLPYGSYDKDIIELSKRAGYERIFLNIPTFSSSKIGGYLVGRIHISLDDWLIEYRLKLLGAYQWLPVAIFIKRKFINLIQTSLHRKKKG